MDSGVERCPPVVKVIFAFSEYLSLAAEQSITSSSVHNITCRRFGRTEFGSILAASEYLDSISESTPYLLRVIQGVVAGLYRTKSQITDLEISSAYHPPSEEATMMTSSRVERCAANFATEVAGSLKSYDRSLISGMSFFSSKKVEESGPDPKPGM